MTVHCVTPNPALDVTYRVTALEVHATNRVSEVTERPGGKGVNVARVLAQRGADVAVYGFLGGRTGARLAELLAELAPGIAQRWTEVAGETRRTVAVVDASDTTMFNEAGAPVADDDWDRLVADVAARCRPGDVVTVSGSLPAGSAPEQLARLVTAARRAGAVVVADTSGPALIAAARAGADVLKPNLHELLDATGERSVPVAVAALRASGAGAVVVSRGEEGLLLGLEGRTVQARLGRVLQGNPTGAGDALVAALASALAAPGGPSARLVGALPHAVAWSAAAVLSPVAGEVDESTVAALLQEVEVKES
jgi:1-phosphofructokinase family hexose kinase